MKTAIRNCKVFPVTSPPIDNGTVIIESGKILAVGGPELDVTELETIDLHGKCLIPGLVEPHTHFGVFETHLGWEGSDGDEVSDLLSFPHLRVLDAINPADEMFVQAMSVGVTTAHIVPSSLTVIGGQTVVVKTAPKRIIDEMLISSPAGMKMSLGENPKRENALHRRKYPATRMGIAATIRNAFVNAHNFLGREMILRDLDHEAIVELLERRIPIHMHVHRADDIMTAVRIADEFNVRLVIHHGSEAYVVADELVRRNIPVVYGPVAMWSYKSETKNLNASHARELLDAGVEVSITTDAPVIPIQHLESNCRELLQNGVGPSEVLEMLTIRAARILGIAHRLGSIEAGKDADLVVLSGEPLVPGTQVERVFIDGESCWVSDMVPHRKSS